MLDQTEISRIARQLVQSRGRDEAKAKALETMQAMIAKRDVEGIAMWQLVAKAIEAPECSSTLNE